VPALFDELIVVDWSASSVPKRGRDSIWIGRRDREGAALELLNIPTRARAFEHLRVVLDRCLGAGHTALVGLDFSLGYPAGFAECTRSLGDPARSAPRWQATWRLLCDLVEDASDNANNRFSAAETINRRTSTRLFWGRPTSDRYAELCWLPPTDDVPEGLAANPCRSLRTTERMAGRGIRSNFQLYGGVTVGGQVLTGVPWLARLVDRFRSRATVWPFCTGFTGDPLAPPRRRSAGRDATGAPSIVFAELWPSLFGHPDPAASVRDEGQVLTALHACSGLDDAGWASWFDPGVCRSLSDRERLDVLEEEGWILGVT
jgi:hypothetical protein